MIEIDDAIGAPGEDVSHWRISRVKGFKLNSLGRRKPDYETQTHPREDGVRINEWPLEELTLETVKSRWGHGTFRVQFFIVDLSNPEALHRHRSGGFGNTFTIDEASVVGKPQATIAAPAQPAPAVAVPSVASNVPPDIASIFSVFQGLMHMSDSRSTEQVRSIQALAGSPSSGGGAEIMAKFAALEAKMEADEKRRVIEDAHRAELAKKDAEIAELKRAAERAEEDADRDRDGPAFEAGTPILEQLPLLLINGLMGLAKTHPDIAMSLVEKVMAKTNPTAALPAPAAAPARPPVLPPTAVHAVPPAPPRARPVVVPEGPQPEASAMPKAAVG